MWSRWWLFTKEIAGKTIKISLLLAHVFDKKGITVASSNINLKHEPQFVSFFCSFFFTYLTGKIAELYSK